MDSLRILNASSKIIILQKHKDAVIKKIIRQTIKTILTGSGGLALHNYYPGIEKMNMKELGLYLHIPFCMRPCFYCPYFKEKYDGKKALSYKNAVMGEIAYYKDILEGKRITSFYIGGGTPTTMMGSGLEEVVRSVKQSFDLKCGISTETHPNDITREMVKRLEDMGVENVSMGIESFSNSFLKILGRPYKSEKAKYATSMLMDGDFKCVNVDFMFGLPNQEIRDVEEDIKTAVEMGVDQISAYPIFTFPHTELEKVIRENHYNVPGLIKRRVMLKKIEEICYDAGMERASVWSFTKKGVKKYSSVTVPKYIGLGAGAGSLVPGFFFINTFSVNEYVKFMAKERKPPVALTIKLSEKEEMFHWLYWRIYETEITKKDFEEEFGRDFDSTFKKIFSLFEMMGMAKDYGENIVMSDRGNYWVHVLQNVFSLDFIGRVWEVCLADEWPGRIDLI